MFGLDVRHLQVALDNPTALRYFTITHRAGGQVGGRLGHSACNTRNHSWPFGLSLLGLLLLWAWPVLADMPGEAEYRHSPHAGLAERAAKAYLDKGNLGRAINWVERMVRSPGVTPAQQNWAAKVRGDLRWRLVDLGLGPFAITVYPPTAVVSIDGRDLLPLTSNHLVWLQEGSHQLLVAAPDHAPVEQMITVARGEKRSADVRLAVSRLPVLRLKVTPVANLWIDGKAMGNSGRGTVAVQPGEHMVELRATGFQSWIGTVNLAMGQEKLLEIQLTALADAADQSGRVASDVRRPVTQQERAEGAERGPELTRGPQVDSRLNDGKLGNQGAGKTIETPKSRAQPASGEAVPEPEAAAPAGDDREVPSIEVEEGVPAPEGSGWKDTTKGWLIGGTGLALLAGGVGYAVLATQEAETANQLPYGDPTYEESYKAAASKIYIGYGALGTGALLSGWGAYYLFGNQGLSRKGKGALLTASGAAAVAVGLWMRSAAAETLASADDFAISHPEFQRRTELGARDLLISYGVAGAGAAVVGTGAWLLLTGSGSRSASSDSTLPAKDAGLVRSWHVAPLFSAHATGATLGCTF